MTMANSGSEDATPEPEQGPSDGGTVSTPAAVNPFMRLTSGRRVEQSSRPEVFDARWLRPGEEPHSDVEFVDLAMRAIAAKHRAAATAPTELGAVVLGDDDLTAVFTRPPRVAPPAGWVSTDPSAWTVSRRARLQLELADVPAPYPGLVSVGPDSSKRVWLIALEAIGKVGIAGPTDLATDFVRYIVADLALNPWSERVQVTVPDWFAPETLGLSTERVRTSPSVANSFRVRIPGLGGSTADVREVMMYLARPDLTHQAITLTADGTAHLAEWGIAVSAFTLPAGQAKEILRAMAASSSISTPTHAQPATPARPELEAAHVEPVEAEVVDAVHSHVEVAEVVEDEARPPRPVDELDADVAAWRDPSSRRPKVRVLGPVMVLNPADPDATRNVGGVTEFIVYLTNRVHGVDRDRASEELGWAPKTVTTRAAEARNFLGTRESGEPWLPDADRSEAFHSRGVRNYELHPEVLTDALLFRRLRQRARARGIRDGLPDLLTALSLVQGRPFDQLRSGGYAWLLDGDRVDLEIAAAISDVAWQVYEYADANGDSETMAFVVTQARLAEPTWGLDED